LARSAIVSASKRHEAAIAFEPEDIEWILSTFARRVFRATVDCPPEVFAGKKQGPQSWGPSEPAA